MTTEIWKSVQGFEGRYEVSNLGRLRSLDRTSVYKDGRVANIKGTMIKGAITKDGYLVVALNSSCRRYIHRIVAETFFGKPEFRDTVNHKNGNKIDNRVDNLEYNSFKENNEHARNNGLNSQHAEKCNLTKFSEQLVSALKAVSAEYNASNKKLAEIFGMSTTHVSDILSGKTRKRG